MSGRERVLVWAAIGALVLFDLALILAGRAAALKGIDEARAALESFAAQPIEMEVSLDTEVPISTTVPLHQSFQVPVETTYHLDTVVQTTIQIPLIGPQEVSIPVAGDIPLRLDLTVPVETEIPIAFTYHLRTTVPVEVQMPSDALAPLFAMLERAERLLRLHP